MATLTADNPHTTAGPRHRRCRAAPARWWLAGLLVGCLLPAGLSQAEWRPIERVVQMCILAPALIRASSQLQARRRARCRWPTCNARPCHPPLMVSPGPHQAVLPAVAAHDVLTRRGPPSFLSRLAM